MKDAFSKLNIILRAIMELGIVLASVYWGLHTGKSESTKIILGISTPILIFGFWGLVDFHNAGSIAEILRLLQELILSFLATAAFYLAGQHALAWILAGLSIIHHALVYMLGETLLKKKEFL